MGLIRINLAGSFGTRSADFSAMKNGHAAAVAAAIEYLSREELPKAIAQDHRLHDAGARPSEGFAGYMKEPQSVAESIHGTDTR